MIRPRRATKAQVRVTSGIPAITTCQYCVTALKPASGRTTRAAGVKTRSPCALLKPMPGYRHSCIEAQPADALLRALSLKEAPPAHNPRAGAAWPPRWTQHASVARRRWLRFWLRTEPLELGIFDAHAHPANVVSFALIWHVELQATLHRSSASRQKFVDLCVHQAVEELRLRDCAPPITWNWSFSESDSRVIMEFLHNLLTADGGDRRGEFFQRHGV